MSIRRVALIGYGEVGRILAADLTRRGVEVVARVERRASRIVAKPEFRLTLDLHAGTGTATRLASDLTVDYVRFNSDYRT